MVLLFFIYLLIKKNKFNVPIENLRISRHLEALYWFPNGIFDAFANYIMQFALFEVFSLSLKKNNREIKHVESD